MEKKHWYDGFFYSLVIDTEGFFLREKISSFIKPGSKIIDVACGTGALVFSLKNKCKRVVGVELSSKMFSFAESKNFYNNVSFYHINAINLSKKFGKEFDYAIICFALHEMRTEESVKVLKQMKMVAKNLIIVDFNAPLPETFYSLIIKLVEFLAGKEHYTNHKIFMKKGGVRGLLKKAGIKLEKEINIDTRGVSKIYKCF